MNQPRQTGGGVVLPTRTPRQPTVLRDGLTGWTRRQWTIVILVVFIGQVLALLVLGRRPTPATPPKPSAGRVLLLPHGREAVAPDAWEALNDPAEFALVSSRGFSGEVWFRRARFARPSAEWNEPPHFLGSAGLQPQPSGPAVALPRSFFSLGHAPEPTARTETPRALVATNSTVRVEGLPPERTARWPELPPVWEHPDVLQPSLVQVTVDEHGGVLTATLLASSGLATADQKALELARNTTFAPLRDASGPAIQWGRLSFEWRTVAPAGAPPAAP